MSKLPLPVDRISKKEKYDVDHIYHKRLNISALMGKEVLINTYEFLNLSAVALPSQLWSVE